MEFKKGDKTFSMSVLGWVAGTITIGTVLIEICKTVGRQK